MVPPVAQVTTNARTCKEESLMILQADSHRLRSKSWLSNRFSRSGVGISKLIVPSSLHSSSPGYGGYALSGRLRIGAPSEARSGIALSCRAITIRLSR